MTTTAATTPIHPEMVGTPAADCTICQGIVEGIALDCAYDNVRDAGLDPEDRDLVASWAAAHVENGDVSAYYCTAHDPINS